MNDSAQGDQNNQNLNQNLGQNSVPPIDPLAIPSTPPIPQTPSDLPSVPEITTTDNLAINSSVVSDQPAFMSTPDQNTTSNNMVTENNLNTTFSTSAPLEDMPLPESPIVNNIPSLSNTPTSSYGSSGGGARRIATALFGIFFLVAAVGFGAYFVQKNQNPNSKAAIETCGALAGQGYKIIQFYKYSCPNVNSGSAGCQTGGEASDFMPGFTPNYCGTQQIDALAEILPGACKGGVNATCKSCFVESRIDISAATCNTTAPPPDNPPPPPGDCESTANYCAPGQPWDGTCCNSRSEGPHCQHNWDEGHWEARYANGCATRPTVPPTAPPVVTMSCTGLKAYDTEWNLLDQTKLPTLKAGDKVRFAVLGTVANGTIDKARIAVNGAAAVETITKKPNSNEFYYEYTIPEGTTTFTVTGEVHHTTLGWK